MIDSEEQDGCMSAIALHALWIIPLLIFVPGAPILFAVIVAALLVLAAGSVMETL